MGCVRAGCESRALMSWSSEGTHSGGCSSAVTANVLSGSPLYSRHVVFGEYLSFDPTLARHCSHSVCDLRLVTYYFWASVLFLFQLAVRIVIEVYEMLKTCTSIV